ncbi:MAG: ribosome maturation factor RimM [Solimonas sp.]
MDARRVTLGRVASVYGVKGWIKVYSYTRPVENILKYRSWWLGHGDGFEAKLLSSQVQGRNLVAQISDAAGVPIDDRDVAAGLIGVEIQVERAVLPKLPDGEYYWADLLGLKVENTEGAALGTVSDVTSNGAQDVLVVTADSGSEGGGEGGTERLIPFVTPQIVREVDVAGGRIVCEWQPDW